MRSEKVKPKLKKQLGLFEVCIYGIGLILGAGIYAIIGAGAGLAGNALWLSFIIAAIVATFTGLSYAELTSIFPKNAAEYVYTKRAFNKESLSFLMAWIMILAGITAGATVAIGFAGYFSYLFGTFLKISIPIVPIAIGLIAVLSLINFIGIKESAKFNIVSTLIEFGGLVIIIILGLNYIGATNINYFEMPVGFPGLMAAAALIFFAFIGFEDMANLTEETKNSTKIIPKAIIISVIVSTILYVLVSISAVSILGWERLANPQNIAPLTAVAVQAAGPSMLWIFSIIALFATANTVLILLIVVSRMMYGVSREKSFPSIFSKIHHGRKTPYFSIFLVMILSMGFAFLKEIKIIAEITVVGIFIIYLFVNLSLIKLRFGKPVRRAFKSPINIGRFPVLAFLGVLTCLFMLCYINLEILFAELVIIVIGCAVYLLYKHFRK